MMLLHLLFLFTRSFQYSYPISWRKYDENLWKTLPSGVKLRGWSRPSGLCRRDHPEIESWNSYPTWQSSDFNELVPPNRTHYAEVFSGSMILWHCNMVLIFELGSILINHFIIRFRFEPFWTLLIQPNVLFGLFLFVIIWASFWCSKFGASIW